MSKNKRAVLTALISDQITIKTNSKYRQVMKYLKANFRNGT